MGQPKPSQDQPSMDEILSSIRRIIERSEAGVSADGAEKTGPDAEEQPDAPEADDQVAPEASRPPMSRSELDSFAEALDARVSASGETVFDINGILTGSGSAGEGANGKYEARFTEDDSRAFAQVASVLSGSAGGFQIAPGDAPAAANGSGQPAQAVASDPDALASEPPASAALPEPLVSHDVSRSVGLSFDALSETLRTQAGRDLGEIAEEMMRPMLADWLDNNLPSIVERLVRAEIERIARGEPRQG